MTASVIRSQRWPANGNASISTGPICLFNWSRTSPRARCAPRQICVVWNKRSSPFSAVLGHGLFLSFRLDGSAEKRFLSSCSAYGPKRGGGGAARGSIAFLDMPPCDVFDVARARGHHQHPPSNGPRSQLIQIASSPGRPLCVRRGPSGLQHQTEALPHHTVGPTA